MVDDDEVGLEAIGEIPAVTDQVAQALRLHHRQQRLRRPAETAQDRRRAAGFDEGALGPALDQRPGQGQAAHDVAAAHLGAGVGEEQDARGG